jgi:hypothetical protein
VKAFFLNSLLFDLIHNKNQDNKDQNDQQKREHTEYLFQPHFFGVLFEYGPVIAEALAAPGGKPSSPQSYLVLTHRILLLN